MLRIRGPVSPHPGREDNECNHAAVYVFVALHRGADFMERGEPTVGLSTIAYALSKR